MNIKSRKLVRMTAATSMLLALGLTGTAQADHDYYVVDCSGPYPGLHDALAELTFKKASDEDGLHNKLYFAEDKEDDGKVCDAAAKLREFQSKMDDLLNKGKQDKITEVHAGTLLCLKVGGDAKIDELDPIVPYSTDRECDDYVKPGGKGGNGNGNGPNN